MEHNQGVTASPPGHSPSGLSQSPLSQAEPSVPNADEADRLGELSCALDDIAFTGTQRAVILIGAWEAMKAFPAATVENAHD